MVQMLKNETDIKIVKLYGIGENVMSEGISCSNSYDSMTGLRDRSTFFHDVRRYTKEDARVHMVIVQMSQLVHVNRRYGIQVGDQLIREIANYLRDLHEEYTAYRIANSRLVLMGGQCTREKAEDFVRMLYQRFQKTWTVRHQEQVYEILSEVGLLHMFLDPADTENDLLDKINYTFSMIPSHGRDGVIFFDENINSDLQRKKYVLDEVRYAIENKTFQMYYQPIYDCDKGRFTSAESLIRLFGRDGSFISPGEFIPMAEVNGLIDDISWIVLEKVCEFLGRHPNLTLGSISINMTGKQILDPDFVERIEEHIEHYQMDGSRLRIEITERIITEDFERVKKVMEYLCGKGIHFYLDDFGTGYSNISSMLSLPFEVIKFDQSLVKTMNSSDKGLRTIGLLADIMHENDCVVVAEGVETELQAKTARERKLDRIQGYYFARPMPEEDLIRFLEEKQDSCWV